MKLKTEEKQILELRNISASVIAVLDQSIGEGFSRVTRNRGEKASLSFRIEVFDVDGHVCAKYSLSTHNGLKKARIAGYVNDDGEMRLFDYDENPI